ncbi:MAG TPA: sensory rhodopsin transducer [Kofleriaceae bacterium]|nr:sensory rhodopsin transducer [Kofleriaceae bacterium]
MAAQQEPLGKRRWAIAEGYIPAWSSSDSRELTSHETACLLNAGSDPAHVRITIYYADRDPTGPYQVVVPAGRTLHLRFNDLSDPEPIPRGTDFSSVIESDVPIVVQHTRLDSRTAEVSLMTTSAYGE